MAISLKLAEAAVASVMTLKASDLFDMIAQNPHSFEKHFTKEDAQESAGQHAQSYFKRIDETEVAGAADWKLLSGNQKLRLNDEYSINLTMEGGIKKLSKAIGSAKKQYGSLQAWKTGAIDKSDIFDIMRAVLSHDEVELRQSPDEPNSRFRAVSPMPDGYVGRSVDGNGAKTYAHTWALVVVSAPAGCNPQVITVYPVTPNYARRTSLLI